jgi:hypothetical protein
MAGLIGGCVEQTLSVNSNPQGALVYLNDEEIGRTPLRRDFTWHGDYEVALRKEGYETLKTHQWVVSPWYNWMPFDLIAALWPKTFHEEQKMFFTLQPATQQSEQADLLISRAEQMRAQLDSSVNTPPPATKPTTKPAAHPPTTQPTHR